MSYLESRIKTVPTGFSKLLYFHWALLVLITSVCSVGFIMLYSNAGGAFQPWAEPQMKRFALGICAMFAIGLTPIYFWRNIAGVAYVVTLLLLVGVDLFGETRMGAQRWIDLGFILLQPSELMKISLVMLLASYYDWLPIEKTSRPLWVLVPVVMILVPVFLTLNQPDLGTALLMLIGGAVVMFAAGVSWWYFSTVIMGSTGFVALVFLSKGKSWQLIKDYQFRRIETFLNPASDPLGDGWNIAQSKIALGSGGWTGRGFMQGIQNRLNFLPEKHTDFIFTTLAEEFGFIGSFSLLALYAGIIIFCIVSAMRNRNRFASLLTIGIAFAFFLYLAVNMSMVMGLAPVVGVPLPLVSYGGSSMLVLLSAFGLVQSAHIHRPRRTS